MENGSIVETKMLTVAYSGNVALDAVSVSIARDRIHAIVGENGAGKSTLVKALTGVVHPMSGQILYQGRRVDWRNPLDSQKAGIAAIYQDPLVFPTLSVEENIFLLNKKRHRRLRTVDWRAIQTGTQSTLEGMGIQDVISPRMLVSDLTIAQRQLLEIAKALALQAKLIIMDEPTASLSTTEVESLFRIVTRLKDNGCSFIIISHKPEDIFSIADDVSVLRDGRIVGTRAISDITRAEMIRMMIGRTLDDFYPKSAVPPADELLRVEHLSRRNFYYDVSFSVRKGEILGFAGLVGSGRTNVAESLFGIAPPDIGSIFLRTQRVHIRSPRDALRLGFGYLSENRTVDGLLLEMTIRDNIAMNVLRSLSIGPFLRSALVNKLARDYIRKLNIKTQTLFQFAKYLSGGNQQKVVLSRCLAIEPALLILDEPTKGVDVGTKAMIHKLISDLAAQGLAIVLISSELPEVLGMSDRIVVMHEGRITGRFDRSEATQENVMAAAVK
jgi:ABC-type sugar transport system ATPase subunit